LNLYNDLLVSKCLLSKSTTWYRYSLGGHVRNRGESLRAVPRLAVTAAAEETAGNIRRVNELEGPVHCSVPG
jgi:hypothetical protein